jgi:hypothetical protein
MSYFKLFWPMVFGAYLYLDCSNDLVASHSERDPDVVGNTAMNDGGTASSSSVSTAAAEVYDVGS